MRLLLLVFVASLAAPAAVGAPPPPPPPASQTMCFQDVDAALEKVKTFPNAWANSTFHSSYLFASEMAATIRNLLGLHEKYLPLRFAYSVNLGDIPAACNNAATGPYVTGTGGQLCTLLQEIMSQQPLNLASYFANILKLRSSAEWEQLLPYVSRFAAQPVETFFHATNPLPHEEELVYWPSNVNGSYLRKTIDDLSTANKLDGLPFYGTSSGGGAGAGWEVFCVEDATHIEETIVTGGGGGGGGFSSPYDGVAVNGGGGAGGGAQIGTSGTQHLGGGAAFDGTAIEVTQTGAVASWLTGMQDAREQMGACLAKEGYHLAVRGGGGGGVGFETFLPWDVTKPNEVPNERQPHGLSVGYGFQFAVGPPYAGSVNTTALLNPSFGAEEVVVAVCPDVGADHQCGDGCIAPVSDVPVQFLEVGEVFRCAPLVAAAICKVATYPDGNQHLPYHQYRNFMLCNSPLARTYALEFLPPGPQWLWAAFPEAYNRTATDPPFITLSEVAANRDAWCPTLEDCPTLSVCRE